ncbi:hypothetical protein EYF80_030022 [Liparis tanakae]|uniref:Uncharacterized protein n=1 Tax=Liparis tanakae TaxID=230148 RepID=A0A4Z2H1V2_9TELE|nr:hypothetical protein EYF80_030022 [Liparis tanakae]
MPVTFLRRDAKRTLFSLVQEICKKTAHDGLVANHQNILLPLQLHDHWLQSLHQIFLSGFWVSSRGEVSNVNSALSNILGITGVPLPMCN